MGRNTGIRCCREMHRTSCAAPQMLQPESPPCANQRGRNPTFHLTGSSASMPTYRKIMPSDKWLSVWKAVVVAAEPARDMTGSAHWETATPQQNRERMPAHGREVKGERTWEEGYLHAPSGRHKWLQHACHLDLAFLRCHHDAIVGSFPISC